MSIIWAIIIGFIVGIVAKFLMPGRDPGGFIVTTLLGLIPANLLFAYFASSLVHLVGPERNKVYLQFVVVIALLAVLTVAPQIWTARKRKERYLELRARRKARL